MGVLGHHHQAGGAPVQPVDGVKIRLRALLIVMPQEKITHCIVKVPRSRVDRHPRGLVQHDHIPVLIADVQLSRGGDHAAAPLRVGQPDGQDLSRFWDAPGIHPHSVQQDAVLQPLDAADHRARKPKLPAQQQLYPHPGIRRGHRQLQAADALQTHKILPPPSMSFRGAQHPQGVRPSSQ